MFQLAVIFFVCSLPFAGLVWLCTVAWYRKRIEDAEDRAEVARDVAADAMEELRQALRGDFESARRAEREVHGFTVPEMTSMAAYETELGASPRLARKFTRFTKRAAGADLPNT
jgi:hypothetical protein